MLTLTTSNMRYHLITLGIVIAAATAISAQPAYRLEGNGSIWVNTGPCIGAKCTWQLLDHNQNTREITASGVPSGGFFSPDAPTEDPSKAPALYQRHADGKIWFYTGTPCNGGSCPGWQMLDNNQQTVSIVAAGFPDPKNLILYKRHRNGEIWRYTQKQCKGKSCPGWERLEKPNKDTVEIIAAGTHLYQRHSNGAILRYTGTPCKGTSCPGGWERVDNNQNAVEITAAVGNNDVPLLYQRDVNGKIWSYTPGPSCSGASCWQLLDNNTDTISIVTSSQCLYKLRDNREIWVYVTPRCVGPSPGWQLLDSNPHTLRIAAGVVSLYQLHDNGAIWRYKGPKWCSGASCWHLLDNPPTRTIISSRN